MASPHSWINEMPVLWEEDGKPVWIDSDTGTFVLCYVLCACWIGGTIGVDGSWIGGKKAIGCRPLGQSSKAAKCHKFTVTGITSGNRDYRGRKISCVLANRNLNLLGGCCLENQVNHKWLWEQLNCDLMFRPCQHTQTLDKLLVVNKTTCSVKKHRDRKITDLSAFYYSLQMCSQW